jgi:hypothetical protein
MKNSFKIALLTAIFSIALTGCGSSPIDQVKNGIMDFNQSTTVGQAIDGWVDCVGSEWTSFETDNGATVVEVMCPNAYNDEQPLVQAMEEIMESFRGDPNQQHDIEQYFIDSVTTKFQFTVNLDDTFETTYIGLNIIWDDGKSHEQNLPITAALEGVYQNKSILIDFELANKEEFDESGYAEILRKSGLLMFRMMAVR